MIEKIKKELLGVQDKKYKNFSTSLLPGINNVIGVKLPVLRGIAKNIVKNKNYNSFFKENDDEFMELTMLEGMVIGEILKNDFDFKLVENFIPKINNWSVCDSFCASIKTFKKNPKKVKTFLEKYFKSEKEFELRFCFVILLNYFIEDDYEYVIEKICAFKNESYYAKMAAAWCLSMCIVKNYKKCLEDIKNANIHPFVLKKGLTKAVESLRLNKEQKNEIRKLRSTI